MPQYGPNVERWRPIIVAKGASPDIVDKLLWAINWESGGDPNAIGDNGVAIGLLQIQDNRAFPGRPTAQQLLDPSFNIDYALNQLGAKNGNFSAWGDGVTYKGKPFGAFGNHPYPYSSGTVSTPSTTPTTSGGNTAILAGFGPGGIIPSPGDILDAGGSVIGKVGDGISSISDIFGNVPGASYFVDAAGNIIDAAGKPLGTIYDTAKSTAEFMKSAVGIAAWLTNPQHWIRLGFMISGVALIGLGGYIYVTGNTPKIPNTGAGATAAASSKSGGAATSAEEIGAAA